MVALHLLVVLRLHHRVIVLTIILLLVALLHLLHQEVILQEVAVAHALQEAAIQVEVARRVVVVEAVAHHVAVEVAADDKLDINLLKELHYEKNKNSTSLSLYFIGWWCDISTRHYI